MPSKIQLDENLWFLFICLQKSDFKTIDFNAVGAATNLKPPAARMRYTRLRKAVEEGTLLGAHGAPFHGAADKIQEQQRKRKPRSRKGKDFDDFDDEYARWNTPKGKDLPKGFGGLDGQVDSFDTSEEKKRLLKKIKVEHAVDSLPQWTTQTSAPGIGPDSHAFREQQEEKLMIVKNEFGAETTNGIVNGRMDHESPYPEGTLPANGGKKLKVEPEQEEDTKASILKM